MSNPTPVGRRFQVRTYVETLTADAIAALAAAGRQPDRVDPVMAAREALNATMLAQGHTLDVASVTEVVRQRVIVNETGTDFRTALPAEVEDGEVITWSALGFPRAASDADTPVLAVEPHGAADEHLDWRAAVPEREQIAGGSVRVRHNLNGEVTVTAEREDGQGIGYHFAMPIDDNVIHVELTPGAAVLIVEKDPE